MNDKSETTPFKPLRCFYFSGCMWGCTERCGDGRAGVDPDERKQRVLERVKEERPMAENQTARRSLPESDLTHGSQISDPVERVIARALSDSGLKYIHGAPHPALDFYLPDFDLYIECKRAFTPRIAEQMSRFDRVIVIQSLEAAEIFAGWLTACADRKALEAKQ